MAAIYSDDMILGVLQARVSSTRLPRKVLMPILGMPMLARQIERHQRSARLDALVVATSDHIEDDPIAQLCAENDIPCFRGDLYDVLDRFYRAVAPYTPSHVVRLTGDCPLTDPEVMDATIDYAVQGEYDYASNCQEPFTFPDGLDVEVMRFTALEDAAREAQLPSHREHVTPFVRKQPDRYRVGHYQREISLGHHRWTVDEPEDFELVTRIYEALYPTNERFFMHDILRLLDGRQELSQLNAHIARNAGAKPSLEADRRFLEQQALSV